jgi:uncharacterized protein
MEMHGSRTLAVTQQQAWEALNDPGILKAAIAGSDRFERTGENQYAVGVAMKIGPVAARFAGRVTLSDLEPPNSYTITFDGQGGAAGFGKGSAEVALSPSGDGSGCELTYAVKAQVGGKIAQLGQRLVDGAARSMAEDFFRRFDGELEKRYPAAYASRAAAGAVPQAAASSRIPVWAWVALGILAIVAAAIWLLG